jgi:hypothetical protein
MCAKLSEEELLGNVINVTLEVIILEVTITSGS